ncbi:BREX-3 system phosphatase PglZ [Peribacillus frigoritolerans]|uniref:BREX-3 system phosphatase PglZ n=1 Tax=Peribacillus frigoritolerans TaxID=450367 RepID=UPI0034378F5F
MSSWREEVLKKFQNQNSALVLVHDEDYLLNDELIVGQLKEYGYDLVRFEDSVSFRYLYEQKYRRREDEWKLIVYTNEDCVFPYEFSQKGFSLSIQIGSIFPKFSAPILRSMNREDFDALFAVHAQYQGSSSDKETLEYIVKQLYKIPYEMIDSEVELYKLLLSLHYRQKEVSITVQKFLIGQFEKVPAFKPLRLEELISSSAFFYSFIEEQWAILAEEYNTFQNEQALERREEYESHPFANHGVRRLMNDLFLEGILSKVKGVSAEHLPDWMKIGIEVEAKQGDIRHKLLHINEKIDGRLADIKLYKDWIEIAELAAEYKYNAFESMDTGYDEEAEKVMMKVNHSFQDWMLKQFHTLTSLPPFPSPKMVHHIPHTIQARKTNNEKVALLVLDGMNFVQWKQVKNYLKDYDFSFEENGVFAWVPTLTSISRQAIFSGNVPYTFGNTIKTTNSEEKYWKAFWENQGILKQYVAYQRGLGKEDYNRNTIQALKRSSVKVYGAVIDVIDQFTHHAVLGEKSLVSNLSLWLQTNYLVQLLIDLLNEQYTIYLTSDHGNTNAKGVGRISEGVLVDQKGERVRIYSDRTLYEDSLSKINSIPWSNVGLPDDYYVLLSQYKEAFVTKEENIVTHGGISIEEVIIPFVKVQQK